MSLDSTIVVLKEIADERTYQDRKWGEQNYDDGKWLKILMEELGEASKDMLELNQLGADEELIQAAAVIVVWVECRKRNRIKNG